MNRANELALNSVKMLTGMTNCLIWIQMLDQLVNFSGGHRTAELVPGAEFLAIEDMAHDLPVAHWPTVADAIATVAARATRAA